MKIHIGPYLDWIDPYQIAERIIFWADRYDDDDIWASRQHKLGRWLALDRNGKPTWLARLCQWYHDRKARKISIEIDRYDVWGMDHTLSLIIVPMLEKLKDHKHGSPLVDNEDLPPHLKLSKRETKVNQDGHWDKKLKATEDEIKAANEKFHACWDWILDEMIWAFSQHAKEDWEAQFHSGKHDQLWQKVDYQGNKIGDPKRLDDRSDKEGKTDEKFMYQMVIGPNDTHVYDREAARLCCERMANGRRLFAKYYESLWC